MNILSSDPRRVLVVVTRRIGDVLLTTPLIHSVKQHWPQAAIDVLVFAGTEGVLAGNPDVAEVIAVSPRPGLRASLRLLARLWRRYDLALSALTSDKATLYAWAGGRYRVGLQETDGKSAWKRSMLLHRWVPFDNHDTHTVRMNLRLAEACGIPMVGRVVPPAADAAGLEAKLSAGAPYAVLHPAPMYAYKAWRAQAWSQLATALRARGQRIVVTAGPAASERDYVQALLAGFPADTVDLSGRLNFRELTALLQGAALYVGPDTVVTHLAAAVGTPTVALFGPSNPLKWGPWPKDHSVDREPYARVGSRTMGNVALVQGVTHCVPCLLEGCERRLESLSECLQDLPVARVLSAAEALTSRVPR